MPSANGYKLEVQGFTLTAVWRAPFYALILDDADEPSEPLLIHCDDLDHAKRLGGILLDSEFNLI